MGNVVLLGIRAETNLSFANVDAAGLPDFSRSNYSCRIYGNVGGGRGGGIAIFSRHSAPCVSRYDVFAAVQRELDHCSTFIFPKYTFERAINFVGVNRPPENTRPPYRQALGQILQMRKVRQICIMLAGDLSVAD